MVTQNVFDKAVAMLTEFLENLKLHNGLTDKEVLDIIDIAKRDFKVR